MGPISNERMSIPAEVAPISNKKERLNPGSHFIQFRDNRKVTHNPQEIDNALADSDLELAKNLIDQQHGDGTLQSLEGRMKIIEKLVELNRAELSKADEDLNYNLDCAYQLACHIYNSKFNPKRNFQKDSWENSVLDIAKNSLNIIANAYADKGNFSRAIDSLNRLSREEGLELIVPMFSKWKSYIDTDCPKNEREKSIYKNRLKLYENSARK